jgi:uncharacterized protein (TIGR02246 family)
MRIRVAISTCHKPRESGFFRRSHPGSGFVAPVSQRLPQSRRGQRVSVVALAVLCLLNAPALSAQEDRSFARDEAAVRAVVAKYVEARESRDPAAIGALFTDDADQFNSAGEWRRGREAIVKGTLQSSQRNSGSRSITIKAIRFPAPDVAIADGEYGIGAQRLWTTLVLARQGAAWRIAAIRNSTPRSN